MKPLSSGATAFDASIGNFDLFLSLLLVDSLLCQILIRDMPLKGGPTTDCSNRVNSDENFQVKSVLK